MKWSHRSVHVRWLALLGVSLSAVLLLRAEYVPGSDDTTPGSALESALFRIMGLPGGPVTHSRPPWEAKKHLTEILQKSPHDASLFSLRAREEELLQDYTGAEADWKAAAAASDDKLGAQGELVAFFARRNAAKQQVTALLALGQLGSQPDQRFQPATDSPQWKAFAEAQTIAENAQLPTPDRAAIYQSWIHRFPTYEEPYRAYLAWQTDRKNLPGARAAAAQLKAAFPRNLELALTTSASLAQIEHGQAAALDVYNNSFTPLWPDSLRRQFFAQLSSAHQLRVFLSQAQQQAEQSPDDLAPVGRLFFYYEQQNRKDVADQQLLALQTRRAARGAAWTAEELKTVAELFHRVQDYDESAHAYYQLYDLPAASGADKEFALAQLIDLLLEVPERPLGFGSRDLSLYKNIAEIDRHPGFLNGILSLALNYTYPEQQYQDASQSAVAYFHRASAFRLIAKLQHDFPHSSRTSSLEAKLFNAYAVYGQQEAIIRAVPPWLQRNRSSPSYVESALLLADSYVSVGNTNAELALYDSLLSELAAKSAHVPIGEAGLVPTDGKASVHSPDYARVLDRYLSRLAQLNRPMAAIALLRREVDHNSDDPGIYERLALFVEQNHLDSDLEQTYKQAFAHFRNTTWANKLARFYLREKRDSDYAALTRQVTDAFKGSVVAPFLAGAAPDSAVLFRQVNLYAHQRFPHNLVFVHNLLNAYRHKETYDNAARARLLREYWFCDEQLRNDFFEMLSQNGTLRETLAALPPLERATTDSNLAALQFSAYGHAWLTDYESAAPAFVRLAEMVPGDRSGNADAIAVERSLAWSNDGSFQEAIKLAQQDVNASPGESAAVTRVGEIYADRELYAQARPWWDRVATLQPGAPSGYLDSATVFWDYFQFQDALRIIEEARRRLHAPAKFSYEAGAIDENENKYPQAVAAYINAVAHNGSAEAHDRLLQLSGRETTASLVEQQTAIQMNRGFDSTMFQLRLDVLEKQNRRSDIETLLAAAIAHANNTSDLDVVRSAADRLGFERVAADTMRRTIALTTDPIEKLQAQLDLGHFYESHADQTSAAREFTSALAGNPNRLGVLRAAVDFYWRNKQEDKAVQTLITAAEKAQPPYQAELRREAAEKASNSGQYDTARNLLDQILAGDPWNGDLLAEKALTYSREKDSKGLLAFYSSQLAALHEASLATADKSARTAALRRGYIAALIAVGNNADALEQYQLVINAFPEDETLVAEVARFAEGHQLADRLVAYYSKAIADSPRDYRWALVLARVETGLRRYPEAITAYDKAGVVRPDRQDIFEAKADLQTRLLRFDDALKTYAKLYQLSFHDSQYLIRQADLNARLDRKAEALKLLRAAYIDPHPREPGGFISVMRQERLWNNFETVDQLFQELRGIAAKDNSWMAEATTLEAQALVALHRPQDAIEMAAASLPPETSSEQATRLIGTAGRQYLTPAEKDNLAEFLQSGRMPPQFAALGLAESLGLADVQAKLTYKALLNGSGTAQEWRNIDRLESARLAYEELGQELEAVAQNQHATEQYPAIMQSAFRAYRNAGDAPAALRLMEYSGAEFPRLFLEAKGDLGGRLATLSGSDNKRADAVVQYLIMNGSEQQIREAIDARGRSLSSLWTNSYQALSGLYLLSVEPSTSKSFDAVLGPRTVGGQLTNGSRSGSLRDADWFYYASRYGAYLGYRGENAAEELLPSNVEANASASDNYVQLGETYLDLKDSKRAEQAYRDALQLNPDRTDVYDHLALLAGKEQRRDQAVELWRQEFNLLAARVEQGPLPESYWQNARAALVHGNRFHVESELRSSEDQMLHAYAKRNGSYRLTDLLVGLFEGTSDTSSGIARLLELARDWNLQDLLSESLHGTWIPEGAKRPLYQADIAQRQEALAAARGAQAQIAREQLNSSLTSFISYLEKREQWAEAWEHLQQIQPPESRSATDMLILAARTGRLDQLLSAYGAKSDSAPSDQEFLNAAAMLEQQHQHTAATSLKEFEYGRELQAGTAGASAWFGLAQVRFERNRKAEGLQLIRDVTLTVGEPFQNLPEAVQVLEGSGLAKEAASYAREWRTAEPWSETARLTLARLTSDTKLLESVRTSPAVTYQVREQAAALLRDRGLAVEGTDELALLTHKNISPDEASRPYFVQARLQAAKGADGEARIRLCREAIAIDPSLQRTRLVLAEAAFRAKHNLLGGLAFNSYRKTDTTNASADADLEGRPSELPIVQELAAQVYAARGNYARAKSLYGALLQQATDSAKSAAYRRALTDATHGQQLQSANLARRPVVSNHIQQPSVVRPRLKAWEPDPAPGEADSADGEE